MSFLRAVNRAIPALTAFALGSYAFVVLLQTAVGSRFLDGWPAALIVVAALAIGWAPAVLVHELGHAVAAHALGWRVWIFSVGPIVLRFRPRLSATLNSASMHDAGGYVLTLPKRAAADTRLRDVMVSVGGPLASTVAAASSYPLGVALSYGNDVEVFLGGLLIAFGASSLACAVLTVWPFASKNGRPNDAMQIIAKFRTRRPFPADPVAFGNMLKAFGFDPAHFDPWVAEAWASAVALHTSTTQQFLDALLHEDFARASLLLGAAMDDSTKLMRAYLDIFADGDAANAERKLASLVGPLQNWPAGYRLRELTLAAILAAAGEREDAAQRLDRLAALVARDPTPQSSWQALIERARARIPAPA